MADYEKLDDTTKQIVDNWEDVRKKALEAEENMRDTFKELAGDIGDQLSDALVSAFRNRNLYSAIDDFHDKMTSTIEDILSQLVFFATFGSLFKELEQKFMDSFGKEGDQSIVDDLMWMENEYKNSLDQYGAAMQDVQRQLEEMGYDAFLSRTSNASATSRGFQALSETTGSELNGRMTALQITGQQATESLLRIESALANGVGNSQLSVITDIRGIQILLLGHVEGIHETCTRLLNEVFTIENDTKHLRSL